MRVSLTITNRHSSPIMLYLEPWGDEHQIPPNKTFRVDFSRSGPASRPDLIWWR